jgi:hypothetical protein
MEVASQQARRALCSDGGPGYYVASLANAFSIAASESDHRRHERLPLLQVEIVRSTRQR